MQSIARPFGPAPRGSWSVSMRVAQYLHSGMKRLAPISLLLLATVAAPCANKPERVEWFRDLGLGLFIHWSLDSQITSVISHAMVGQTKSSWSAT